MNTRRTFLQTTLLGTALFTVACASDTPLESHLSILKIVQTDLFPQEHLKQANAFLYLSVILKHSRVSDSDKEYLKNGARWLNEEAQSLYKKEYIDLDSTSRQKTLQSIAQESWGRSWIKVVLLYIMEASLGDPIYGINKNEFGWKWVKHEAGLPRPKEALL